MDEFGSAVRHNDDANSRIAPFLYAPNNKLDKAIISYSVSMVYMWDIWRETYTVILSA